jgi:hypothetical protein
MSQRTAARLGFCLLVLAALTALSAVAGVRLGWLAYGDGYRLMFPATGLGLLALAAALFWLGAALKANQSAGRGPGLIALFGALLLVSPPLSTVARRLASPPIHDFTTDTENPPRFVALLKFRGPHDNPPGFDGGVPVRFEGEQRMLSYVLHDHYRDILKPHAGFAIGSKDPLATFFWRDFETAKKTGWTIVDASEKDGRIEATHASFWFGRISDIVIQVRKAGAGARTDLRSQSRDESIDDGFNAANAKRFFGLLAR